MTVNVESPCVRNCCLDTKDVCLGCFRTLEEIKAWGTASEKIKREVIEKTKVRKKQRGATY